MTDQTGERLAGYGDAALVVEIPGQPCAKGRPRFGNGRVFTPAKTVAYESIVYRCGEQAIQGLDGFPLTGPIALVAVFRMMRRQRPRFDVPAVRPDLDNLLKSVVDGLQNARVFRDDALIVELHAWKIYGTPGVTVRVYEQQTGVKT